MEMDCQKKINVMKKMILICFLSVYTICMGGTIKSNKTILEQSETEPFLTSFIEDDQLYLNIPDQVLDRPMMFIRYDQDKKREYMQVVWSLHKDKILLVEPSIQSTAGIILPLKPKLDLSENILAVFPLEKKYSRVGYHCVNITDLVLRQDIEWKPGFTETLVPNITLLIGAKDLESEVIIETRRGIIMERSKIAMPVFFGFCALEAPMKARRYDYRMGFWNEVILGIDYNGVKNSIANISRWRLEKKYKAQDVSIPNKPITFILSPEIPKKWRPYIKAGIEEWLPAFESAGFRDALVVKEVDTLSDWQKHSINTSVIYWGKKKYLRGYENEILGAAPSKIIDERTGEILQGNIHLNSSPQSYAESYFIRAAPLDKRAKKFPLPDEIIGKMLQSTTAHEAGHVFGLMDGNYGEYSYPFEKMNDIEWLENMGFTPSVMNYTRPNNIVQPEDNIPAVLLIQKVGPTDRYSILWAYTEFPPGTSEEEEAASLERIVRSQDSVPWYRYNNGHYEVIGPAITNEVVETNDPVRSTTMAVKNIKRVIELLPEACSNDKDNGRLERLYDSTIQLWYHHMRHVVSLIGGYDIQYKSINQPGSIYTPIPLEVQEEAMEFLIKNAFNPPQWLTDPDFEAKRKYSVNPDKVLEYQQSLIIELLRPQRLKRFEYLEKQMGFEEVTKNYLSNLQGALFKELMSESAEVEPRNREIQLTFIDKLNWIIQQERVNITVEDRVFDYTDYSKGLVMGQLMSLKKDIAKAIKRNKNNKSMEHWKLCLYRLNEIP